MPRTDPALLDSFDRFVQSATDTYTAVRQAMADNRWDAACDMLTNLTNEHARVSVNIKNIITTEAHRARRD